MERARAEEALRESEKRQAFLLKLSDAMRPLVDPAEIQNVAVRLLGEHLNANQVHYGETIDDYVIIYQGYGDGLPPMVGRFKYMDFGERLVATYRAGKTAVCYNVDIDPTITEDEAGVITGSGFRAYIAVPLVKDGEWVATMAAHSIEPRAWSPHEVMLVEDVAERTWAAVERAKAGKALTAERKRIFDVLETLPVMICLITPDYHIPFANKAFREKFGEAEGRYCYDYCCGFTEPCAFCESLIPLKTGQAHRWEFTSPDGNTIIDAYDFPFSDTDGSPLILEMNIDITERKSADEALRESEKKALVLVGELEKADRNKNQFISVLSHELRNPLAAILAGVQLLDVARDINQASKVKEIINRQTNQLCKLVDDLLELTRISQNKIKLKKENINLNEILKRAAEDIRFEYEKKGIELETKILPRPVLLNADPVRITQIIGNILNNALKFTQANGAVWLTLKVEKDYAVISVKDNGIGMSPEILPHLFEPFIQADNTLERSSGGLGLGLSIVKGIVDLHNGNVNAFSAGLGRGSTFTIRLPITAGDNLMMEKQAPDKNGKNGLKLLIIEDNRDFADLLSTMLSTMGCSVDIAYDGIDGVKLAKQIKPDVVFCDIGLPGMNGYDVAKSIRNNIELKNVNLIALTGYVGEGDAECALEAGFNKHLAKPVDFAVLKSVLSLHNSD